MERRQVGNHAAPGAIAWNYTRIELVADLIVHAIGVCFGLIAAVVLVAIAVTHATAADTMAVSIYAGALLLMLSLSAAYNTWPVCQTKWLLRRFDHSAIYVMIAASYTPFVVGTNGARPAAAVLVGVWCVAALGIAAKLALPGRFDRLSIAIYLAMGWSAVMLWKNGTAEPPPSALRFVVVSGALYTLGVVFHLWQTLRFQNAIWHCFVLLGSACQYAAVLSLVLR